MSLTATGSSGSTGDARLVGIVPLALTASGSATSAGDAVVTSQQPIGMMNDLAFWPAVLPDPAVSCVTAVSAPDSTGRAYLSATIPDTYTTALGTLWNAAASAAVTATWEHASANSAALTDAQIEYGPGPNLLPPDAADYRNHMVYEQYAVTQSGTTVWDALCTRVTGRALSGDWCGQLANVGGLNPYSMGPLPLACAPVVAGAEYAGSVNLSIVRAGAQWYAQIMWFDAGFNFLGTSAGTTMTHPGAAAWQLGKTTGTAPSAGGSSAAAVYAAVVPAVIPAAVGDGELAWADCHRLWSMTPNLTSAPSAFSPTREQIITLRANRINYFCNPSFTGDIVGWWGIGGGSESAAVWDDTVGRSAPGSLKMSVAYSAGTGNPQVGTNTQGVGGGATAGIATGQTGGTYTMSVYVQLADACPTVQLSAVLGGGDGGIYVQGSNTGQVMPDADGWYRLSVTYTIPESVAGSMNLLLSVPQAAWVAHAGTVEFWVDDALCEASPLLGTYFDATMPSPDYLWEAAPFRSRSHYYQNLRFLQYRLSELLEDALPTGVAYQLLFAQPDS